MEELPKTVVGIDIETTSLEPEKGEIIEVAAIRFDTTTGEEIERFEHLCAPKEPISDEISSLTGITQEMVKDQPDFSTHIKGLLAFIDKDVVFAHNATFDLSFLKYHGADIENKVWDTFPLATVAWPTHSSYNLGTLAQDFNVEVTGEHRAGEDIVLTWKVLQKMLERLRVSEAEYKTVKHLMNASQQSHYLPLFTIQTERIKEAKKRSTQPASEEHFTVNDLLGEGGILVSGEGRSYRPGQLEMAKSVAHQIEEKASILIEAPTGTGKTFGYLVPALLALQNDSKGQVVVSTYTHQLQDQLVEEDIPELLKELNKDNYSYTTLKGRRNYICSHRLSQFIEKKSVKEPDAWTLLKIFLWLESGGDGDIERLNLSHQSYSLMRLLHANTVGCRAYCGKKNPNCPYQQARKRAQSSSILVVNHALLMNQRDVEESDKKPIAVIIDEAHHLENAAISASEVDFTYERVAEIIAAIAQSSQSEKGQKKEHISSESQALLNEYQLLLRQAYAFVQNHTEDGRIRLSKALRSSSGWHQIQEKGDQWLSRLHFIIGLVKSLEVSKTTQEAIKQAERLNIELEQYLKGPASRVQWIEVEEGKKSATLRDAALDISAYIQTLQSVAPSIVYTSATLTIEGSFEYVKDRLGLVEIEEKIIENPFSLKDQMGIFVVTDGPTPGSELFDRYVARSIVSIAKVTAGRLLGLLTSHRSVRNVYKSAIRPLNKATIKIYAQKITGGRHNISKRFKDQETSILLGTSSFWEGLNIPGESLSVVVIPKLPFPQIGDPVIDARSEQVGRASAFNKVILPHAILRLRQGVGRLVRSDTDRGVIVILDRRLAEKNYGQNVLHSLPPTSISLVQSKELIPKVKEWFGEETLSRWKNDHQKSSKK